MNSNNSIVNIDKKKCCGCGTCALVCPKKTITMEENDEGFLYPKINSSNCIRCGLCVQKCPLTGDVNINTGSPKFFGYSSKKSYITKSASGGFATSCSEKIIDLGGIVCGCALINNEARHIFVEKKEDLHLLQSSKYVQSNVGDAFLQIKGYLQLNRKVLFIGTPCQVSGLKCYLGNNYDNLLTIDLICHGVPSPKAFKLYIKYLEHKENSKITNYNFRYKPKGRWGPHYYSYYCADKNVLRKGYLIRDKYGNDFLKGNNYRESCYVCQYTSIEKRPGDFTIGDFWSIEKFYNDKQNVNGVSSVIAHSTKAIDFLNENYCEDSLFVATRESVLDKQGNLFFPSKRSSDRDFYYANMNDDYFKYKKVKLSIKEKVKIALPYSLRKILKKWFS